MKKDEKSQVPWLVIAVLIGVNLIVFSRLTTAEFVNYDDPSYVTENAVISSGLNSDSLKSAFTEHLVSLWLPLTSISLMSDCHFFGVKAGPMHRTNLLLHIVNTVLLLFLIRSLLAMGPTTSKMPNRARLLISAFVALAFAVHPMHVEPVAWISSRKDVLSTMFWLICTIFYIRLTSSRKPIFYGLTLLSFCLGLMAKPTLVTLPFTLLLLDLWPLERLKLSDIRATGQRLLLEKIPLFLMAIFFSWLSFAIHSHTGAEKSSVTAYTPLVRLEGMAAAYGTFLYKAIVPTHLSCSYPHPAVTGRTFAPMVVGLGAVAIVAISITVCLQLRKRPYLFVGWFWFTGAIFPVSGIIPIGAHYMADRYSYVSFIGLFLGVTVTIYYIWERHRWHFGGLCIAAAVIGIGWTVLARAQVRSWQNSEQLWLHALEVNPDNFIAHNQLGNHYSDGGHFKEALPHFQKALELCPNRYDPYANCANALTGLGRLPEADQYYRRVLSRDSNHFKSLVGLGRNLIAQKKAKEAITFLNLALEQQRQSLDVLNSLAAAHAQIGQIGKAVEFLREANRLSPNDPIVTRNLQKLETHLRNQSPF